MANLSLYNSIGVLQSKTVWGAIVAFAGTAVGAIYHATVTPADISAITDVIMQIVSGAGALFAIYGRITATQQVVVGGPPGPKEVVK